MNKEKIMIGILVLTMVFSVFGTSLLLILDSDSNTQGGNDVSDNSQDDTPTNSDIEIPETFIPEGDVKELAIVDLKEGSGKEVKDGDTVTVYYHGTLADDGTVFDSAFERGTPITFPLDNLIEGWKQGIPGMKEGGVRRLVVPSELAYGEAGSPPSIGANADLVFVIQLEAVQ